MKKQLFFSTLFSFLLLITFAQNDSVKIATLPAHPRLFWTTNLEQTIQKNIANDAFQRTIHDAIIQEADRMISLPKLQHELKGKRLLGVSRECLRRTLYLSYAWRMTQKSNYKIAAIDNLETVCDFKDWNPKHFLDVAEMTLAVAVGYDWLYQDLSATQRKKYKNAIIQFGLIPSEDNKYNYWLRVKNNWNQVCNSGLGIGALAIYEDSAAFCNQIINRGIKSIDLPMHEAYNPEGAYPEGYAYWGYGTTYNVLLIDALQKIFKDDFGLSEKKGFLQTTYYMENMTGNSGYAFNYSDGGAGYEPQPAMAWFAQKEKNPSLLWIEKWQLSQPKNVKNLYKERMLPFYMIWNNTNKSTINQPKENVYFSTKGACPLALMRTGWNDTDIFVGVKGGTPSANHAHMDGGSFVLDAMGERWAMDLGAQDYYSLESKGVDLWNNKQNSQRWEVFRYNNKAHNTLTINDSLQRVKGFAKITKTINQQNLKSCVVDLGSLYDGLVKKSIREISIIDNQYVQVIDKINSGTEKANITWTLVTQAQPKIIKNNTIELSQKGKKLYIKSSANIPTKASYHAAVSKNAYDVENKGVSIVTFEFTIPANTQTEFKVLFSSNPNQTINKKYYSLQEWK